VSEFQAKMFNRKAANPNNKPDQILGAINLRPGQSIADIGSGGGYFSFRFAETVGENGRVYAVDENKEYLDLIKHNAEERGIHNLILVAASESGLNLPEKALDFIFMRNVTHHISDRATYFKNLRKYLKSDGRVVVIEYKKGKPFTFRRLFAHHVPKETIVSEMSKAGFSLEKEFDFLPEQHFTMHKIMN
jgi:arsenite methyltransferase